MDVHLRRSVANGFHNVEISLAGVIGVNAALQTDLCGAQRGGLCHTTMELVSINIIGRTTRRHFTTALGKRAEATAVLTHVGVIDVAVDDIADCVTHLALAQLVRRLTHGFYIGIASAE